MKNIKLKSNAQDLIESKIYSLQDKIEKLELEIRKSNKVYLLNLYTNFKAELEFLESLIEDIGKQKKSVIRKSEYFDISVIDCGGKTMREMYLEHR